MDGLLKTLGEEGLRQFHTLELDAVSAVTQRFFSELDSVYAKFGQRGRDACREDIAFHLEFLRPVLEFGLLAPMVDYLCWLASVLAARTIPGEHLALSLTWLAEFFAARMSAPDAAVVTAALEAARTQFLAKSEAPGVPMVSPRSAPEAAFEAALLAGDQREALAVVNRYIDSGHDLIDVEVQVIQAAMYRIGEKWQLNQVTVAQEHIATAIVQWVMTAALLRSTPLQLLGKRVLLACVAGNRHTIGLRMVADSVSTCRLGYSVSRCRCAHAVAHRADRRVVAGPRGAVSVFCASNTCRQGHHLAVRFALRTRPALCDNRRAGHQPLRSAGRACWCGHLRRRRPCRDQRCQSTCQCLRTCYAVVWARSATSFGRRRGHDERGRYLDRSECGLSAKSPSWRA